MSIIYPIQSQTGLPPVGASGSVLTSNGSSWVSAAPQVGSGSIGSGSVFPTTRPSLVGDETMILRLNEINAPFSYSGSFGTGSFTAEGQLTPYTWGPFQPVTTMVGSNSRLLGDAATIDFHLPSTFTVSTWVRFSTISGVANMIIAKPSSTGAPAYCEFQLDIENGYATFVIWTGASPSAYHKVTSTSQIPLGKLTFVVVTYDGTDFKIYLNGVLDITDTYSLPSTVTTNQPLVVGNYINDITYPLFGQVSEIRFNPTALTLTQVQNQYNQGITEVNGSGGGGGSATVTQYVNSSSLTYTFGTNNETLLINNVTSSVTTLPSAEVWKNAGNNIAYIKNVAALSCSVLPSGSQTIDGASSYDITSNGSLTLDWVTLDGGSTYSWIIL